MFEFLFDLPLLITAPAIVKLIFDQLMKNNP